MLLIAVCLCAVGCGGAGFGKLSRNDPETAAAEAMELYDGNSDGMLTADELQKSPPLAAAARRIDRNGDGAVAKDEIQTRMQELEEHARYYGLDVHITSKGRALIGAELTLIPEPFMGDGYPTYSGKVAEGGACVLTSDGKQLPGVPAGFYQAKIIHSGQQIDAIRGVEISDDTTSSRLEIAL